MTPKEKAIEIHTKMFLVKDGLHKYPMCFDTAKQCALIAVNQTIEETKLHDLIIYQHGRTYYWESVKKELEKL
jgi:hypothetical protein